jgi:hypothetical protein
MLPYLKYKRPVMNRTKIELQQTSLFPSPGNIANALVVRRRGKKKKSDYYKAIKEFMLWELNHRDFRLVEKYKCPVDWAKTFLHLITDCVEREDYEGAAATKDAIREFLNGFGADIPEDAQLKLPEYKPVEMHGIICYGQEGDPSGIGSGGADWI